MEFFLRPKNSSIWSEVQDLAQAGDQDGILKYVAEAQRLTSPFVIIRYAARAAEIEGKLVKPSDMVLLTIVSVSCECLSFCSSHPLTTAKANAARDPADVPNANSFDAKRQQPEVTGYSYGQHECFGKHLALTFVAGLVMLSALLKNLRPAPGMAGRVKSMNIGRQRTYLNDSW